MSEPSGSDNSPQPVSGEPQATASGRLLGVDFGTVRVGLAVSDRDRRIASPHSTYTRRSVELDAAHFRGIVRAEGVVGIVLGLPVHLNGREGMKAKEARQFGAWLVATTGLPLIFWDERFTTAEAESALWGAGLTHRKRKERRDRVAAQLLLQTYLEAGCPGQVEIKGLDDPPHEEGRFD